jgi:hypothetical protein
MRSSAGSVKIFGVIVLKLLGLYSFLSLRRSGALKEAGWFKSVRAGVPIDRNGRPIPWMTYSAIGFLEKRIDGTMSVFEYGCGNSTLWWADRVRNVVSCEHDRAWYQRVRALIPANVELHQIDLEYGGPYAQKIAEYHQAFDIVVIDGRDRVNCGKNCLYAVKKNGVIIWDDSDRECYAEGYADLLHHGYKRIDFEGMTPVRVDKRSTAVFYKGDNCLGI